MSLTREFVLLHVREQCVRAHGGGVAPLRQGGAVGQSEVAPGLEVDPALLVVFDHGPLVVAKQVLDGNAIFPV